MYTVFNPRPPAPPAELNQAGEVPVSSGAPSTAVVSQAAPSSGEAAQQRTRVTAGGASLSLGMQDQENSYLYTTAVWDSLIPYHL